MLIQHLAAYDDLSGYYYTTDIAPTEEDIVLLKAEMNEIIEMNALSEQTVCSTEGTNLVITSFYQL
ncbi:MAG TPA: hypothetical protein PLP86_10955 [Armatimonadota bacterium]|nr:hypothetical protein [Armatimonadota bacterium]